MKKFLIIGGIVLGVGLLAALSIGVIAVSAQAVSHMNWFSDMNSGRGGGHGMGGGEGYQDAECDEAMHDLQVSAYAEALGLPVDEINQRLDAGERMSDIALSTGMTLDEFHDLRGTIRTQVIDEALAQGLITQEQADWMKEHTGGGSGMRGGGMNGNYQRDHQDCGCTESENGS